MNHKHQPTSTEKKRERNDTAECLVIINDIKQDDDGWSTPLVNPLKGELSRLVDKKNLKERAMWNVS